MSVSSEIARLQETVAAQAELIEKISTALEGKAGSGGEDLDAVLTEQEELIAELQDVLKSKASGVGQTIYYTRYGACYVPNMIIEPSDGVYNESQLNARYQYATHMETVEIPNIVLSASVPSVFGFCSSLRTAKVAKVTNYGHYWFRNCTALETAQLGSLGYPVTSMTTLVFSGDTQSNLTITIYVDATTLAELPTGISNNAPFGAKNATIIYRNSTTGEVITE